jgi:hypothetical protein
MSEECPPRVRQLYHWEIQEARRVFGNRLDYTAVRIHECNTIPDKINRIGTRLKGMPAPTGHNAITLGNHCYFPVLLLEAPVETNHPDSYKIGWLIHELTHCWQYQHLGWKYLALALRAQFREGAQAYHFGGEDGLLERMARGEKFSNFNLEQQGDICRSYYERIVRGQDIRAWGPFIAEVQGIDRPMDMMA